MATPSRQSVAQPDQKMIRFATTKASGESTEAPASRNGRSHSGSLLRKTPNASGAPAYISTLAEVMKPTRVCQLGNGRKQMQPITYAVIRPTHGTPPPLSEASCLGQ